MIHLNKRSAKKKFEKLKGFLSQTGSFFRVLCLTETWFDDRNSENLLYQLPQYTAIHQHRSPAHKSGRGGGISMYIHDSLNFKSRRELDLNTKNEPLSIELMSKNSKTPFCQRSIGLQMVILKLLTLFWKMYIPFPWSPINFSMPPGTLTLTFSTTTKMKKLRNFWI